MIGCCGFESESFKNKKGHIENKKLELLLKKIDSKYNNEESKEIKLRLKKCSCPCHIEGANVLC